MARFKARNYPFSLVCNSILLGGIGVPNDSRLNPTDVVALEAWVKPVPGQVFFIFDNSTLGTTNSYFFYCDGTGGLIWFSTIGGLSKNIPSTTVKMKFNQWNLIGAKYDGVNIVIYLNGATLTSLSATGALGTNNSPLRIGNYYNGAFTSTGVICRPRIYHRIYTLVDHRARYFSDQDDAVIRNNIVLDYPLNEGTGTTINDASGNGLTGTVSTTSWAVDSPGKNRSLISMSRGLVTTRTLATARTLVP